jgi:dCMP deaminase
LCIDLNAINLNQFFGVSLKIESTQSTQSTQYNPDKQTQMLHQIAAAASENKDPVPWDDYFMSIAFLASMRSPCTRLRVGSVVVKDHRIIAMGYNGFIAGAPHISHLRDNHEQAIIHSEINAVSDCARRGASLQDAAIYVTHYPCINCFRSLAACGIKRIYYYNDYNNDPLIPIMADDAGITIHHH